MIKDAMKVPYGKVSCLFLLLAPEWRLVRIMNATVTSKPENRARANLRLDASVWRAIDDARGQRAGYISRNTWVLEAVLEKLAREQQNGEPMKSGGGRV